MNEIPQQNELPKGLWERMTSVFSRRTLLAGGVVGLIGTIATAIYNRKTIDEMAASDAVGHTPGMANVKQDAAALAEKLVSSPQALAAFKAIGDKDGAYKANAQKNFENLYLALEEYVSFNHPKSYILSERPTLEGIMQQIADKMMQKPEAYLKHFAQKTRDGEALMKNEGLEELLRKEFGFGDNNFKDYAASNSDAAKRKHETGKDVTTIADKFDMKRSLENVPEDLEGARRQDLLNNLNQERGR